MSDGSPENPKDTYSQRLVLRRRALKARERTDARLSNARLGVFIAGLGLGAYLLWGDGLNPVWLALPGACFLVLVVLHDRVIRRLERARDAVTYYQRGLDRLADNWQEHGIADESYCPDDHPYAADLDLFGRGSLYQLLCAARTRAGEETLAAWLLTPAPIQEARRRQAAVQELTSRLDLREDLALLGGGVRARVRPGALERWADEAPFFPGAVGGAMRAASILIPLGAVAAAVAWAADVAGGAMLLVALVISWACHRLVKGRLERLMAGVDRAERDLVVLGRLLARLETEPMQAPMLAELAATLGRDGVPAAAAIRKLSRLVSLQDSMKNAFFAPVGLALMWFFHTGLAIERWRLRHGSRVSGWLAAVGQLEALSSLAGYAYERPDDPFPELQEQGPLLEAEALGHPLLPRKACVRNPVRLDQDRRMLVVSGSNMSGKSTLLRTVGVNAVLAQAGAPVMAARLAMSPLMPGATIRVQDSLQRGASRFYQEISTLKLLMDLTSEQPPLLFLLDEILHGTNSQDRRVGAAALLERMLDAGAVGLVTTHDLALSEEIDRFGGRAANVHFVDQVSDGQLSFDYKVRDGVVSRSNAIALMRSVGLPV